LFALVAVAIMMLLSCRFSFGALVVGSESMSGAIEKGDVIIYEAYSREPIAEGEVIVFDKEGVRTIHRVDDVQQIDGEMRYYTKGDANEERDTGYVTESEIVGTVIHRLPAIGYPTLMIDSLFD
ncbi:MAG: signal peptidase I, partial [Clostridia bacterium]|nr:signal peptidase I [Clostridia bacterium]